MEAHKKIIIKISVIFVCVLLVITFFSSTIYTINLPSVSLALPRMGSTVQVISGSGYVEVMDKKEISTGSEGVITFTANVGDTVLKGETLFTISPVLTGGEMEDILSSKGELLELYDLRIENIELRLADIESKLAGEPNNSDYLLAESDLSIQLAMLSIERKGIEDEISSVNSLQQEVEVMADEDMIIAKHLVQSGGYVSKNTPVLETVKTETTCKVNMQLTKNAIEYIAEKMIVTFNIPSTDSGRIQGVVESVSDENGGVSAKIRFNGKGLTGGELAVIKMENAAQVEKFVVPNSAISMEGNSYCVYTVKRTANPIGYDYVIRQVSVLILSTDDSDTAIKPFEDVDLSQTPIVINSDRMIFKGSRVQLSDGSDYIEAR